MAQKPSGHERDQQEQLDKKQAGNKPGQKSDQMKPAHERDEQKGGGAAKKR